MGADVLASLGGVAVSVWEWLRFAWRGLVPVLAVLVSVWALVQTKSAREVAKKANAIAEGAKAAADEGNVIAEGARTAADKANEISERMETLAREANDVANRALTTGEGAKEAAIEANRIAQAANELAQDANKLFKHQEARETEQHDVHWEGKFVEPGVYRLTNKGRDTAYRVVADVDFNGEEFREEVDLVPGGKFVEFSIRSAADVYEKALATVTPLKEQLAELKHQNERNSQPLRPQVNPQKLWELQMTIEGVENSVRRMWVDDRVLWKTRFGNPKEDKTSGFIGDLGAKL